MKRDKHGEYSNKPIAPTIKLKSKMNFLMSSILGKFIDWFMILI